MERDCVYSNIYHCKIRIEYRVAGRNPNVVMEIVRHYFILYILESTSIYLKTR